MGHFPGAPLIPGVLQIEAMAQTGGILVLNTVPDPENYITLFLKIENARFKDKVVPGDTIIFHCDLLAPIRRGIAQMKGIGMVGEKYCGRSRIDGTNCKSNKTRSMIQPLAYIHPQAKIADNVVIEPFVTIHKDVEIGEGTWIGSNSVIMDGARIGKNCRIFPGRGSICPTAGFEIQRRAKHRYRRR
jgi:NDP-sugar pyrophosphorylase family protein